MAVKPLRWPDDCPDVATIAAISAEEYTRLADDGCPHCVTHVAVVDQRWLDFLAAAAGCRWLV